MAARERTVSVVTALVDGLSVVIAALLGFAAGAVFTAAHRATPPWMLLLGLAIIVAMVIGYRLAFGVRRHAVASALGVIAAVALFSLQGLGGTVLVQNDALGWSWSIAAPGLAVLAVLVRVPRRFRRATSKVPTGSTSQDA